MAIRKEKVPAREQDPHIRRNNFEEVTFGYSLEEARSEAERCIQCKNPRCIEKCPVSIDIPAFISLLKNGEIKEAALTIFKDSTLPSICGRVCPQESQCEGNCILGKKNDPVAIGKLERFVGDWARDNGVTMAPPTKENGIKVAVIGSGPAGLSCATDLRKGGYDVSVFEALHKPGGVLEYGIPEFRLPKEKVVRPEIDNLRKMGVSIETDVIIGRTITIDQLFEVEGFDAVFIGSGAGLPKFMSIPGENLNGVFSANEYLTRANLMKAYEESSHTPIYRARKCAVVGGGNVAMDAARTALRMGSEVHLVYRRSEAELPARLEEVHHAREEGIIFQTLTNPVEIIGDENGWVKGIRCVRTELGEPDASGRRSSVTVPGSEFVLEVDAVIMSLGTSPNPLISTTTPGLEINKWRCIVAHGETGATARPGVFAGGDAVTGAATVIQAMGAGRKAARAIHEYILAKHN
jgi:glutamate synthase (NADPH) small chain